MHKRFIAGATCPQCAKTDVVYLEHDEGGAVVGRRCHACGFAEQLESASRQPVAEPAAVRIVENLRDC